ncbi:MAG: cytochrome c oxidase subunit 3, partial [Phycisphaerales bacterium]|nr:cytochrome c oxidase subunit 3 [Phycisphaerales bacterium]
MGTPLTTDIGQGGGIVPPSGGFGGGDGSSGERGASRRASFTGLYVALAAIVMFFAALTSTYVVRRGLGNDWVSTPLPPVIWVNTAVLLLSSAVLEIARRRLHRGARESFNRWWTAGTVLGCLFLAGQYIAWRELWTAGIYLATNPSSSLFYVFSGAHALHLIGGVI